MISITKRVNRRYRNYGLAVFLLLMQVSPLSAFNLSETWWANPQATIHANIPGQNGLWNATFPGAAQQWSNSTSFNFSIVNQFGDPCSDPNVSTPVNGVEFSFTECGDSWGSTTLAVTIIWGNPGPIRAQAGIVFNSNEAWDVYSGPERCCSGGQTIFDFRRVAVHELGHVLGLNHEDTVSSVMCSLCADIESPTADDITGVNTLYGGPPPPPIGPDAFEPDNSIAAANSIFSGNSQTHNFHLSGDVDWVTFSLSSTSSVRLETIGEPTAGDTVLKLYSNSASLIEEDDDDGNFAYSLINRSCNAAPLQAGTYFASVEEFFRDLVDSYDLNLAVSSCNGGSSSTPDQFAFEDVFDVQISSPQTSMPVTISGIDAPVIVSVGGDLSSQYSINGAGFTDAPGFVSNNDSVRVRHTSADGFSTATSTLLTVGGVDDTFSSITVSSGNNVSGGGGGSALGLYSLLGLGFIVLANHLRRRRSALGSL